ncbi:MAG TPA: acetate--CoA ligase family protein [Burkholderiaceae bacterium]|nr:acetate--CoA ligase family protein [Burkholderiaceae bacterium]
MNETLRRHDPDHALRAALYPRSIAVIGASDNPNKIGGRPLVYLERFGFGGEVYPVNPSRATALGRRTFPDLASVPQVPDMVIVAVAGQAAVDAVHEAAARGVKVALVMASGFSETGADGRANERKMVAAARAAGMRIVGPNSQGLANFGNGAVASFSTMFIETPPAIGPVGIVSQSGALSVVPYHLLRTRGIGVRHSHATGNDADVSVCELATIVADDPQLELLLLYLEGIPDPWNLAKAAAIARRRGMPVVALKAGRTPAGQQAAMSHTGALANEDRVVDAFLEQHGILRVQTVNELVDSAALYLKGWRPRGRRLVAISNSGAVCVLAAAAATAAGLPMAKLADDTRAQLGRILPGFATTANPIDITAALLTNSNLFSDILPVIARDPAADAFLIGVPVAGAGYDVDAFARDSATFAADTGKPIVVAAPQAGVAAKFAERGLAVYTTESDALRALGHFLSHHELIERVATRQPPPLPAPPEQAAGSPTMSPAMLNEADSLALLADAGVPVVRHRMCGDADEAVAAWRALGGPVAVKGCSSAVAHKSELGWVHLKLESEAAVRTACAAIAGSAKAAGLPLDGLIVAAMTGGRRELMLGARIDPVFGPVVLVGDGGRYVEAMPDLRVLLAPFDEAQVLRELRRLRIAPLLDGVRGEPPLDVAAFCTAAVTLGRLMADRAAGVVNVDVNPLMVGAQGEGCVALDAVVYREGASS